MIAIVFTVTPVLHLTLPPGDTAASVPHCEQCLLHHQVVEAERRLRGALLVDGLKAMPGYQLCRYNDPFTLPFVRRNEVLIELEEYSLDKYM